jgi:hypothetical protein
MPRTPRLHRLEPTEHERVHADLRLIHDKIKTIYTLVDQRFGVSNKRALRLQALKRKLDEVESLFSDKLPSGSPTAM